MELEPCAAAKPVAPWLGAKTRLAKRLIELIASIPHKTYAEPFVGMGGVFLRRPFRPTCEVANDRNGEIVNLFRVLQRHYPQLMEVMRFQITSRSRFETLRQTDPATLTDLERAARFLYLMRLAFGGQVNGVFGVSPGHAPRFDLSRIGLILEAAHERLAGVVFENLDWTELIERYDARETLFYLDPPYHGGESDYGKGLFSREDFARMAEILGDLQGRFILSINAVPEAEALFAPFNLERVDVTYTINREASKPSPELIVTNFDRPADLFTQA